MEKKELDKELELARKGAEAVRAAFDVNEKLEKRIEELEKKVLEQSIIIKLHSDELKHASVCLDSNINVLKLIDEKINKLEIRFSKHINNEYAHEI